MRAIVLLVAACGLAFSQQPPAPARAKGKAKARREQPYLPGGKWRVHDDARPKPRTVLPGKEGSPPSDAIVLFDGSNLSHWISYLKGVTGEPKWKVENGYMEVVRGTGSLISKEKFGTAQYHIEWATPAQVNGSGQGRGNSGVYLMRRYEVQILDSWENPTYADGQAAAIYGQHPPLVNASRKPGEWQTYDIIFDAPVFEDGKVTKPPYVTVLHNGVVVHDHVQILGRPGLSGTYAPHAAEEPLMLQDHPGPVRYRNIWVRPLKDYDEQ
jgi:hypothetical protein